MSATGSVASDVPWAPASQVAKALGMSMALFGYPGSGKTTFAASAGESPYGRDVLILDLESGGEVLADRDDIMIWPKPDENGRIPEITWDGVVRVSEGLKTAIRRGDFPIRTLVIDTMSAAQRLTLAKVMKSSPTPEMPSQPEYGKSNELLLQFVRDWCSLAKETGVNVIFIAHAEEIKDESTGVVLIRMSMTPGVIKGIYQAVSSIAYLAENTKTGKRRLLLKSDAKVLAKFRQPQSGPQLPLEIDDPSLGKIIDHRRNVRGSLGTEVDRRIAVESTQA